MSKRERGAIAPLVAGGCMVLITLGVGGATVGRIVAARMDAQRAADAHALAVADLIREEGMQGNQTASIALAERNANGAPVSLSGSIIESTVDVRVTSVGQIDVTVPSIVEMGGDARVMPQATAKVSQYIQSEVTMTDQRLVMVLDYSGSMNGTPLSTLESSVNGVLDKGLEIAYAATFFDSSLRGFVEFDADNDDPAAKTAVEQIKDKMNSYGASGGTCTSCGLDKAYELLTPYSGMDGNNVLLVSDGAPNSASGAQNAAKELWAPPIEATIYTLHITSGTPSSSLKSFMVSVSGTPEDQNNEAYYIPVSSSGIDEALNAIVAAILCSAGPVGADGYDPVEDPDSVRVFLRDASGYERKLTAVDDLSEVVEGFMYDQATGMIRMTSDTCDAITEAGNDVVVRYNRAKLIE